MTDERLTVTRRQLRAVLVAAVVLVGTIAAFAPAPVAAAPDSGPSASMGATTSSATNVTISQVPGVTSHTDPNRTTSQVTITTDTNLTFENGSNYHLVFTNEDTGNSVTLAVNSSFPLTTNDRLAFMIYGAEGGVSFDPRLWYLNQSAGNSFINLTVVNGSVPSASGLTNFTVTLRNASTNTTIAQTASQPSIVGYSGLLSQNSTSGTVLLSIPSDVAPSDSSVEVVVNGTTYTMGYNATSDAFETTIDAATYSKGNHSWTARFSYGGFEAMRVGSFVFQNTTVDISTAKTATAVSISQWPGSTTAGLENTTRHVTIRPDSNITFESGSKYHLVFTNEDTGASVTLAPESSFTLTENGHLSFLVYDQDGNVFAEGPVLGHGEPDGTHEFVNLTVVNGSVPAASGMTNFSVTLVNASTGETVAQTASLPSVVSYTGVLAQNATDGQVQLSIPRDVVPADSTVSVVVSKNDLHDGSPRYEFPMTYNATSEAFETTIDASNFSSGAYAWQVYYEQNGFQMLQVRSPWSANEHLKLNNTAVSGTVTLANGSGAANHTVWYTPVDEYDGNVTSEVYGFTDAGGAFSASLAPATNYSVRVWQLDVGSSLASQTLPRDGTVDFWPVGTAAYLQDTTGQGGQLPVGHVLNVTVVDARSGDPVYNATVAVTQHNNGVSTGLVTNTTAAGVYDDPILEAPGVEVNGTVSIEVTPPPGSDYKGNATNVTVTSDRNVTIVLEGKSSIVGGVDYPNATPADGLVLVTGDRFLPLSLDGTGAFNTTQLTEDIPSPGTYRLGYLQLNESSSDAHFLPHDGVPDVHYLTTVTDPAVGTNDVGTMTLPTAHLVNVTVVDRKGNPVQYAGFQVLATDPDGVRSGGWVEPTATTADGQVVLSGKSTPGIELAGNVSLAAAGPINSTAWATELTYRNVTITGDRNITLTVNRTPVTPTAHDFGGVTPGSTETVTVTVTNNGDFPWETAGTSIVGADPGQFTIVSGGGTVTLEPGESHSVTVEFAPGKTGSFAAALRFENPGQTPAAPLEVPLSGNGTPEQPSIALSTTSLSYGGVGTGETVSKTITVTNTGNATLNVTGASVSGTDAGAFAVAGGVPASIAPGDSATVSVSFSPSSGGAQSATLTLSTNDPDNQSVAIGLSGEGLTPNVEVTGATFGEVAVGNTSTATVTISNTGEADLRVSDLSLGGADADQFAFTDPGAFTLAPGESRTISVTYSPNTLGTHEAAIEVLSDDPDSGTVQLALSGSAVGEPNATLSVATLSFGTVQVGGSATETVTVTNDGTGYLDVGSATITANASAFNVTGDDTVLAPGESTTVSVTFTPTTESTISTTLSLVTNASGSPHDVAVNATGATTPAINVTTANVTFAPTEVGANATATVRIANDGTEPLEIDDLTVTGNGSDGFAVRGADNLTVAPGNATTVTVVFAPTLGILYEANLSIASDDPDTPTVAVPLSGTGMGVPNATLVTPRAVAGTALGSNATLAVRVANNGTGTLNLTGVTITGPGAAAFTVVNGSNATIAPGETGAVLVRFAPDSPGSTTANLTITTSDDDTPTLVAELAGTGLAGELNVTQAVEFGGNAVDRPGAREVTIRNTGNASLTVNVTAVVGADADAFAVGQGAGTVELAPGEAHTVRVVFTPGAAGNHTAALELSSSDPDEPTATVALRGVGQLPQAAVDTAAVDFGSLPAGSATTQVVTITNTGNATLTVNGTTVTGPDADRFRVVSTVAGREIAPGGSLAVTVRYRPDGPGTDDANLTLVTTDPDDPTINVSLSGTGDQAELSVSPVTVDFGRVAAGDATTRQIQVTNEGGAAVEVTVVQVGGPDAGVFSAPEGGFVLEPGETETLTVTFEPSGDGPYDATLTIEDNRTATADVGADLTGQGVAPVVDVEPRSVNFGNVTRGETVTRTVTIANDGSSPLRIERLSFGGPDPGAFSTDAGGPITIAAGTSRTITVSFTPTSNRTKSAYLHVHSNDPRTPVASVWLSNTDTVVEVESTTDPGTNTSRTNVTVTNATADSTVPVNVSSPPEEATNASVDSVNLTVTEGGSFTLSVTQATAPDESAPTFNLSTGTEDIGYMNVEHSVPDENISEVEFTVRVKKSALAASNASAEDVAMYRYHDGSWQELQTTVIGETATHYVFRVTSPGLSDFTTGVKQPKFDVTRATVQVTEVTQGESVGINVRITNTGGADGEFTAKLILDGEVVDQRTVTVAVNGTRQITFEQEFTEAGEYEVRVNEEPAGSVVVTQAEVGTQTAPGSGADDGLDPTVLGGLLALLAILALGAGAIYRRSELLGGGETTDEPEPADREPTDPGGESGETFRDVDPFEDRPERDDAGGGGDGEE